MIGEKIKEYRVKNNMTQKDLSEKLFVTAQAVSRWENGEVEPSLSTIKKMAEIFNVKTDVLLEVSNVDSSKAEKEIVYAEAPRQHLAVCEICNKPIYESNEIVRVVGRVYCKTCNDKRNTKIKQEAVSVGVKRRIWAIIVGVLIIAATIALSIYLATTGQADNLWFYVIGGVLLLSFSTCMILFNTFVPDMFCAICRWGVVSFPGLIWEFSLDGFLWLIGMKLLFWLLGMLFGLLACIFSFLLSSIVSLVMCPVAIVRNIVNPALDADEL